MESHEKTEWAGGEYSLSRESVERMAAHIETYLLSLRMEHTDVLRIRFALEEALLRWRDRFGADASVRMSAAERLGRPTITLELTGDPYDPLTNAENDLGMWADSLLSGIGLNPLYTYRRNTNTVQLRLKRRRIHPALALCLAVAVGLLVGFLGDALLPERIQEMVLRSVFDPVQSVFLRILNTAAGPIVFFSVLTAVCGVGSAAALSRDGRRLIARFFVSIAVMTLGAAAIAFLVFRPEYASTGAGGGGISGVLDFLFRIIPPDLLSPMISGDSPQLILIALILGHAFLTVGRQTDGLVALVEQVNAVGLLIADWVGRVTPFFVSVLLILGILGHSTAPLRGIWLPAVLFLALAGGLFLIQLAIVSRRERVSPRLLLSKMSDSFLTALRTSSVNSAYGTNQVCCERRLGIDRRMTKTGLPLGLLIYMPAGTVAAILVLFYEASACGVTVSPFWLLSGVLLTVALQAASPPVSGIGLLTYAVIFTQLGIPQDALITAMVLDIFFGLVTAPLNQAMLQLELVLSAGGADMLNRGVLRKETTR